jgi:glycosyltransferase A (GT-A) superfamily protein (DUF2064 family)
MTSTTTKKVRWECPNKKHPGVLSSSRPAKDSIVRYCLPCSIETGTLTTRIAPALERKRATSAQTAAAKAKAKRAREAAAKARKKAAEDAKYTVGGVDLRVEMKKLLKLRAFGGKTGRLFRYPPEFTVTRRSYYPGRHGFAETNPWGGAGRINIATYPGQTLSEARETLVHELTHIVVGQRNGEWHGREFRQTMTAAFKEAYKVLPVGVEPAGQGGGYAAALSRKEKGETA